MILTGSCFGWSSHALYVLQGEKSPTGSPISELEANLIGSLLMLGNFLGTPFSAWVSDRIGKKMTTILCSLGLAVSFVFMHII